MTNIYTLIPDIKQLLKTKGWFTDDLAREHATSLAKRLQVQYNEDYRKGTLRLSQMGPKCPRALWFAYHHPELAEEMPSWVENKFSIGHMIEAWAITLAKAAGHQVTGEQDAVFVDGIEGHRDCVIDGAVVDIKSASSRSFIKFKDKSIKEDDPFGYLEQLDGYVLGSVADPLVTIKDRGYLLPIDKQLGHLDLYEHHIREEHIRERVGHYKFIVSLTEPPQCTCETIPDGTGGNIALGVVASYSAFKHQCFPGLRTFLYAGGPRYLSKVVKRPTNKNGPITEVTKDGQYNFH